MPCDIRSQTVVDPLYSECLDNIQKLIDINDPHAVIIAGDLNTDISRDNSHSRYLNDFVKNNDLYMCWESQQAMMEPTYEDTQGHTSVIDHFICSGNLFYQIENVYVSDDIMNRSNHKPIHMTCNIDIIKCTLLDKKIDTNTVNWDRATNKHLNNYKMKLDYILSNVDITPDFILCKKLNCKSDIHNEVIESLCDTVVKSCLEAAEITIPKKKRRLSSVPYWNQKVKPELDKALFWHSIWKECGRPQEGWVADIRRSTRKAYHHAVKNVQKNNDRLRKQRMAEYVSDNRTRDLWKEIKKMKPSSRTMASSVDGLSSDTDICELFRDKYSTLFNSVSYELVDMIKLKDIMHNICDYNEDVPPVAAVSIKQAIRKLNKGKSDGDCGLISDHIINASVKCQVMLSILFSSILSHSYVPHHMLVSTIVSIPKNIRGNLGNSDNYRGISLCSSLCKLLDIIIIDLYGDALVTSDLQFAFKKNHSTSICTSILKETVSHYLVRGSSVFSCYVDASKAFDKVNIVKMFRLLLKRKIPAYILNVLLYLYEKQQIRCRWGTVTSEYFTVTNGVRQGAILSPLLFNIYMDELLMKLKSSGKAVI